MCCLFLFIFWDGVGVKAKGKNWHVHVHPWESQKVIDNQTQHVFDIAIVTLSVQSCCWIHGNRDLQISDRDKIENHNNDIIYSEMKLCEITA